jgi:Zn-finger nucleic acid-binding protein
MNCPNDGTNLLMTSRENIEIDYCPQCRGVWLDRGELDKLIEQAPEPSPTHSPERTHDREEEHKRHDSHYDDRQYQQKHHKKKRESFLGDIFDF